MTDSKIVKLPHHEQAKLCETRAAYRQGRKLTAVKVYTINNESRHLIVANVPKLQLRDEVKRLFSPYGDIKVVHVLKDYPCDQFEEAFHIHYARIQSARIAKHFIDGKNFYGGSLHVFYAPELENLSETREKIAQRRKDVAVRIKRHQTDPTDPKIDPFIPSTIVHRKKKHPALLTNADQKTEHIEESLPACNENPGPSYFPFQPPYQLNEDVLKSAETNEMATVKILGKRKNYKGRNINESASKAKIFKPQIVDTTVLFAKQQNEESQNKVEPKNSFVNVKKVDRGITIKVPQNENKVKRIVMKVSAPLIKPSEDLETSIKTAKEQIREAMSNQISAVVENE